MAVFQDVLAKTAQAKDAALQDRVAAED